MEKAARLKAKVGFTNELIDSCEKRLQKTLSCRFSAVVSDVSFIGDDELDIGFGSFKSRDLIKNLSGCSKAYIFAVTTGLEVDRLLSRLYFSSPSEHFITDALASAYAEAACDLTNEILAQKYILKPRFSPGYGDFPLECQPSVLKAVNAERLLSITISRSLLMTPKKSITAVAGIVASR